MAIRFLENQSIDGTLTTTGVITASGGNSSQWNAGYANSVNSFSDSGSSTITLSIGLQGGVTLNTSFSNPQGTVTSVSTGVGLDGSFSTSGTITLDLSELTDMTATMVGTDEFIVLDSGAERRKAANEIGLSIFNNDAGFTSNVGDITAVNAGTNLTGGGTSGSVTLNMATGGVGAGTYGSTSDNIKIDNITVDAYGRVTAVSTGSTGDINGITAGAGLTGGGTSGTPTISVDYAGSDSLVMAAGNASSPDADDFIIFGADSSGGGDTGKIQFTDVNVSLFNNDAGYTSNIGDITNVSTTSPITGGGSSGSVTIAHANSGVTAGSYARATVTVNATGHVTSISANGDAQGVTSVATGNGISGGTITSTGTLTVGAGDGLSQSSTGLLVDSTVVRTSGAQSIGGVKIFTSNTQFNGYLRGGGQQLVLNAGESYSVATGQTNEFLYINAESGLEINSSPDNWSSGWAGRKTTTINDTSGNSTFANDITVSGGDITLGGTGRIQGVDTVSSGTDAANKTYVDNAIAGVPQGDITAVVAGNKLTGGGTSGSVTLGLASNNISQWTNDSGYTTNTGTVTSVALSTGTGLDGGGTITTSGSFSITLDLSELADMTQTMIGTDEFIVLDNGAERRKAANEIGLSIFSNDAGFTSNVGDITAVNAGTNLTGGGTSGSVTLNMATGGIGSGTYGSTSNSTKIDNITVDAYGRVTAVSTGATGQVNQVNSGNLSTLTVSSGTTTTVTPITAAVSGSSSSLATGAQIQTAINTALTGVVQFEGTWNASTNTPTLTSSVGTSGDYYIVSVAGSTNLNGITDWAIGDWAVFANTTWTKVDNSQVGNMSSWTLKEGNGTETSTVTNGETVTFAQGNGIQSELTSTSSGGTLTITNTKPNIVQTTVSGNAGSATVLQTARTIAGVSFNGSANISLNNNAITNGAGYITSSSLPTVGNGQIDGRTSGNGLSGSMDATANQSGNTTFTVTSNATTAATASTIAYRDSAADINARLFRSNYQNQSTIGGAIAFRTSTTDNYIRFCSDASAIRTFIGAASSSVVSGVTSVATGGGLTGGTITSTGTLSHADTSSQGSVNNSGNTYIQDVTLDTYGHVTSLTSATTTLATLGYTGATNANYITNNNQLTNGAGYITSSSVGSGLLTMSTGTGLDGGTQTFSANSSANVNFTITLDLSELTDMTATMVGTDEFIVLDNSAERRKAANEIGLSIFSNDAGFTSNTGDITAVNAGTNLTGGGTSGSVTLNMATGGIGSGTYGSTSNSVKIDNITVDAYGRVTAVSTGATGAGNGDITAVVAGDGLSGGASSGSATVSVDYAGSDNIILDAPNTATGTLSTSDQILVSSASTNNVAKSTISNLPFTNNSGDITNVSAGTGMSGGGSSGSVTLNCTITNNNQLTNGAGYTTNAGTVQGVFTGSGLTGGVDFGTSTGTLAVDYGASGLINDAPTASPQSAEADDYILIGDDSSSGETKKVQITDVGLSNFNNDAGFKTSSGVTSIATSSPVLGGTITSTGTISVLKPVSGAWHNGGVAIVGAVTEIGRYIDFHTSNTGTSDFDVRLDANGSELNVSTNIRSQGNLEAVGNIVAGRGRYTSGNAFQPSIAFTSDTNTGMFNPASDTIQFATGGAYRISVNNFATVINQDCGIGVTPLAKFHVNGTSLVRTTTGVGDFYLGNNASANHFRFHTNNADTYFDMNCGNVYWRDGGSIRYRFFPSTANMTINGTLTQNSDIRIKENIVEVDDCISKVQAMRGVYYNRTDFNTEVTKVGVIAQEVEAVLPELILENEDDGLKSVAYSELTAVLINAVKEQQIMIEDLKARIEQLEK